MVRYFGKNSNFDPKVYLVKDGMIRNFGKTLAYINNTGGLYLTGALTQNVGFR